MEFLEIQAIVGGSAEHTHSWLMLLKPWAGWRITSLANSSVRSSAVHYASLITGKRENQ